MELTALYQRVIGLDVHQAKITACAIVEHNDGEIEIIEREFGAFKRDRRALAEWARELAPERVVMESTGTLRIPRQRDRRFQTNVTAHSNGS